MKTGHMADCVAYAFSSVSIRVDFCESNFAGHSFAAHVPNGGKTAFDMPASCNMHAAFRARSLVWSTYVPRNSNEARCHLHSSANIRACREKTHTTHAREGVFIHTQTGNVLICREATGKRVMCGIVVEKDRQKAVSCAKKSAMHECLHLQRMLITHDELQGQLLFQISGYIKMSRNEPVRW